MPEHGPSQTELKFSVGGGTVVVPQPDERAFALRQNDFLTLCEGEVSKADERWRDIWIAIFVTAVVGTLSLLPTVDWRTTIQQSKLTPCISAFVLCSLAAVSFVLSLFFWVRSRRRGSPSAYMRVKKKIENYFREESGAPEEL